MKVETLTYSRTGLVKVPDFKRQQTPANQSNDNKSVQSKKVAGPHLPPKAKVVHKSETLSDVPAGTLPQNLSDVLSAEEQALLQQLFPAKNAQWGVSAYERHVVSNIAVIIGTKLDLTS